MALRLLSSLGSKQILPRVICYLPEKLYVACRNEGNATSCNIIKEPKKAEYDEPEQNKDYFRDLFHEIHPVFEEESAEKGPENNMKHRLQKNPNVTFQKTAHESSLLTGLAPSHVVNDNLRTSLQDPFPEDIISTEMDPEILDAIGPPLPKSFNLAAFADKSETIQQLIKLGVNLFLVEKSGHGQYYLDLDFERDVKNHLIFFKDIGVDSEEMGTFISRNPAIFKEELEDLKARVDYLKSKKFRKESITRIITKAPMWLNHSTKEIDSKLGFLQKFFTLSGNDMRFLVTKKPKMAICNFQRLRENNFLIHEQMGFTKEECRKLLLDKPKLWLLSPPHMWKRFDYLHNEMKIPHNLILLQPETLLLRHFKVRDRHLYLKKLGRAQYDPTKEGYVALKAFFADEDVFCEDTCKTSVDDYNKFLKSL